MTTPLSQESNEGATVTALSPPKPVVSLRDVRKTFAGTRALRGLDLDFLPGEIHAVCGGNGSGKSTMIKILAGVYQGDEGGTVTLTGTEVDADKITPAFSHQNGVRVVHQDLAVFPELTVAENFAIDGGFETGFGRRIRWKEQHQQAARLLREFNIPARPGTRLASLSLAARTQIAIARSLRDRDDRRSGLLILDEPTAALPHHEVDELHTALKALAARGQSIVYVSHRLDEVLELADRVTVLRDGELVGSYAARDLTETRLIDLMLGRDVKRALEHEPVTVTGPALLEVKNLTVARLRDVSFSVSAGEVLGVAGLMGSGRTTLLRSIFGDLKPQSGSILLDGKAVSFSGPGQAMRADVAMVPENRLRDAAFVDHSVDMNISIGVIGRYWRKMVLRQRSVKSDSDRLIKDFSVKTPSGRSLMSSLSGGNQQKVVMARWLRRKPRLILLDEPTQGVDVGARADIYAAIREATKQGASCIVVASDFKELAQVVDRALVLRNGEIVAELDGAAATALRLAELSYADVIEAS